MKYLRTAVCVALLVQATQSQAADGINFAGSLSSENSCELSIENPKIDLGDYHYKDLNRDHFSLLHRDNPLARVDCRWATPLALKFRSASSRPVIGQTYRSLTLAETGTSVNKTVAYADILATPLEGSYIVRSGHLDDPLVLPPGLPLYWLNKPAPIHGDPLSSSEPQGSGITFINSDKTLAVRKLYYMVLNIGAYATPTNDWADAMPDVSSIPMTANFTVAAVYL